MEAVQSALVETESENIDPTPTQVPTKPLPTPTAPQPPCDLETSINNDWDTVVCEKFETDTGGYGDLLIRETWLIAFTRLKTASWWWISPARTYRDTQTVSLNG